MSPKFVLIAAGFFFSFTAAASAGFLDSTTAANDTAAEFAKRISEKKFPAALIRTAEMTGWTLYRSEALSDAASFLFASSVDDPARQAIAGSIVLQGTQWRVRFYSLDASGNPVPEGDVVFSGGPADGVVVAKAATAPFGEAESAMIRAQEKVLSTTQPPCEGIYKTITLAATGGGYQVYRLRSSLKMSQIPEGQHIRYDVSADGATIVSTTEYSRRCNILTAQTDPTTKIREARFTDPYNEAPSEIHVYLSLRYSASFFMLTSRSNKYWNIVSGAVIPD
jgi:hypothetical protein